MEALLKQILEDCRQYTEQGEVATYIPELAKADKREFGICIVNENNECFAAGDFEKRFTMQSIIKPMILLMALMDNGGDAVRRLVGVEATGKPFDSFNYSYLALIGA